MSQLSLQFQSRVEGLCPAYLQFLAGHKAELLVSDIVVLYGRDSIEERNNTHEVAKYLPDYVCIGNDSGDYEFLLRRDGSEIVLWEDPGAFSAPSLEMIHSSFSKWLTEGCPLPETPECPIPLQGRIWLLRAPDGGMQNMFQLKKMLAMDWSIPQMKQILEEAPSLLIEHGHPFGVHRSLLEHRNFRPLLGFSDSGSDSIRSYMDFDENFGITKSKP